MAETKPGTPPVRARIGNTGEEGRRHPATCLSHRPRGEELPINHLPILSCHGRGVASRLGAHAVLAVEPTSGDRNALLIALTTEHVTLQSARSATITESLGRSTIYLGSLSASLVAFAFIAQGQSTGDDFRFFALLILPALFFLGTATFVRTVETGIEDATYAQAINRIRHYYLELAGEDARYFTLGGHDDMEGVLANMGFAPSPWRPFFSVASVIALINSMVAGALTGVALDAFARRPIALIVGIAAVLIALAVHYRFGFSRFVRALERFTPIFPSSNP